MGVLVFGEFAFELHQFIWSVDVRIMQRVAISTFMLKFCEE